MDWRRQENKRSFKAIIHKEVLEKGLLKSGKNPLNVIYKNKCLLTERRWFLRNACFFFLPRDARNMWTSPEGWNKILKTKYHGTQHYNQIINTRRKKQCRVHKKSRLKQRKKVRVEIEKIKY